MHDHARPHVARIGKKYLNEDGISQMACQRSVLTKIPSSMFGTGSVVFEVEYLLLLPWISSSGSFKGMKIKCPTSLRVKNQCGYIG